MQILVKKFLLKKKKSLFHCFSHKKPYTLPQLFTSHFPRMQSLYLTSYIASPLFLDTLTDNHLFYDIILSDIAYENSPLPLYHLTHKPPQQALLPFRADLLEQAHHPLIILGQLPLSFLQPLLDKFSHKPLTIINLYVGMGSIGRKLTPELEDLTIFPPELKAYEPIDLVNFFSILEQPHAKYLRIPHLHFPESIFTTKEIAIIDKQMIENIETLSLKGYGYAGDGGTFLATGANFSTLLQLGDMLQAQGKGMDMFILSTLTGPLTEEIKSSLHTTKKLFLMIDHLPSDPFKALIEKQLSTARLRDITVQYITPQYEKLTTIFDEFSAEQTVFDAERIILSNSFLSSH
ncbi:MAG: hypothetical protein LBD75_00985 [Candidatus Peribacteria bacterium]|nr:hypothetical protein [Candidatus Peribacteria bacterium]